MSHFLLQFSQNSDFVREFQLFFSWFLSETYFGNNICKETLEYYAPKCLKYCVAAEYFAIEDTMVNNDQGGWLLVAIIMKKALTDPFPQGTESVIN